MKGYIESKTKESILWVSESGKSRVYCFYTDKDNSKIKINISHNYGDYWFDGKLCNNTGWEYLTCNSSNLYYAIQRGRKYLSNFF